jgi:hypothetical protein
MLTTSDLIKIEELMNKLLDKKLEDVSRREEIDEIKEKLAKVQDDVIEIKNFLNTDYVILQSHVEGNTTRSKKNMREIRVMKRRLNFAS